MAATMPVTAWPINNYCSHPARLYQISHLPDGTVVFVRPIRPEDDALERAFIDGLSKDSLYTRLLSARRPTPDEISRLTRIDYDREIALVAIIRTRDQMRLIGDARYIKDAGAGGAEFAMVVADAWQRKGVGTLLLQALLRRACVVGVTRLHGIVLASNQPMKNLARKLGFVQKTDPQGYSVRHVEKALPGWVSSLAASSSLQYPTTSATDDELPMH